MVRNDAWFEWLVGDTSERLLRYALRRATATDAEDVVAETFLVAWRRRGAVPEPPEHVPWLYGVARRQLANARRGERRRERLRLAVAHERPGGDATQQDPRVEAVLTALERLPDDDAELLRLLTWEELSQREAAIALGVSENAVALRASRARQRLREMLDRSVLSPDMSR